MVCFAVCSFGLKYLTLAWPFRVSIMLGNKMIPIPN